VYAGCAVVLVLIELSIGDVVVMSVGYVKVGYVTVSFEVVVIEPAFTLKFTLAVAFSAAPLE
jgi:hypothetical protein